MAFRIMQAMLMNCPINYEDKKEATEKKAAQQTIVKPVQ
jgi:hypothetical protein